MKIIQGNVTTPKGFQAAGVCCSIKSTNTKRRDIGMIYSGVPCTAAGIFTTNAVKAAPVLLCRENLADGKAQAVIVNSYVANTCTVDGPEIAQKMCELTGEAVGIAPEDVIVASTGVIGRSLPIGPVSKGIAMLKKMLSAEGGDDIAKAIMTTDTVDKQAAVTFELGGKPVHIGVIAKGSGMIDIQMGTMLSFTTTDAAISAPLLKEALSEAANETYNMVCVDGDMSTNDTLTIMANGLAGNPEIIEKNEDYECFVEALKAVYTVMARKIAADGEGATKLMEVEVCGAADVVSARKIAKSIVRSALVKTAMYGSDANWGRILCAIGYSGCTIDPKTIDVKFSSVAGEISVCENGGNVEVDEQFATEILKQEEVTVHVNLGLGNATATAYGCDLSYEYVRINGDYRS